MIFWIEQAMEFEIVTIRLAIAEVPNISSELSCLERLTDVFMTFFAFLEVMSESTIMAPAAMRKSKGVFAGPMRDSII